MTCPGMEIGCGTGVRTVDFQACKLETVLRARWGSLSSAQACRHRDQLEVVMDLEGEHAPGGAGSYASEDKSLGTWSKLRVDSILRSKDLLSRQVCALQPSLTALTLALCCADSHVSDKFSE
eukprot:661202-Amphidinium_carterae.1